MSDRAVCRTAPATPGLLIILGALHRSKSRERGFQFMAVFHLFCLDLERLDLA